MATQTKYPTKRLECFQKGKELRAEHYLNVARAKEQGKLLVLGCAATAKTFLAGLGPYEFLAGEPYGAAVSADHEFSLKAMETFEAKGYPRDMCAYMRNQLGSMFLNKYYFTGEPFPKLDFLWSNRHCPCGHPMWHTIIAQHQGIPYYAYDDELQVFSDYGDMEKRLEYLEGQLYDSIEWMEKVTGRTYDVEPAIEEMNRQIEGEVLWGEINLLEGGTVPCPVDLKTAMSLLSVHQLRRGEQCSVDFLKEYRDEVKDRIAQGIAAVGNERFRIYSTGPPSWPFLRYMRELEDLGVVHLGLSMYIGWGVVVHNDDDTVVPAKTPQELGWPPMKTLEDLVKTFIRWRLHHKAMFMPITKKEQRRRQVNLVKHCKADAVTMSIDRGCPPQGRVTINQKQHIEEAGFPVLLFETNRADFRDIDPQGLVDRMESFLESLGITKGSGS